MPIEVRTLEDGKICQCGRDGPYLLGSRGRRGDVVSCSHCSRFHFIPQPWWKILLRHFSEGIRFAWGLLLLPFIAFLVFESAAYTFLGLLIAALFFVPVAILTNWLLEWFRAKE